jgi:hypothetical protein
MRVYYNKKKRRPEMVKVPLKIAKRITMLAEELRQRKQKTD